MTDVSEGRLEVWKADFRPEKQVFGLRGRMEALRGDLRPDLRSEGVIRGLEG